MKYLPRNEDDVAAPQGSNYLRTLAEGEPPPVRERLMEIANELDRCKEGVGVWKRRFQRYGQHSRRCPGGARCTCGFDAIINELIDAWLAEVKAS